MMQPFLTGLWTIAGAAAALLSLPGSVELLLLSAAALVPRKQAPSVAPSQSAWRVAVVIPAHNERVSIISCIESLLKSQPPSHGTETTLFVVADNCTDDTARLAALAGARVFERHDPDHRGKGYALDYAFNRILAEGYDCVLVIDADTSVAPNFLSAAADALRGGAQAVQARYLARNADDNIRTRLMGLALRAFNVVRPLGREHLGLSCGINGTGFGLRRETLIAIPYLASSIVEDLEYHLALVRSGRRVHFLNQTTVFPETPVRAADVKSQRSRWEGGRLRMLAMHAPPLARDVLKGELLCLEPLLELMLLPLAFHTTLVAVAASAPLPWVRELGMAGMAILLLHLAAALTVGGGGLRDLTVLAVAPFYILWKLMLLPRLIRSSRSSGAWVRTGRNHEPANQRAGKTGEPNPERPPADGAPDRLPTP